MHCAVWKPSFICKSSWACTVLCESRVLFASPLGHALCCVKAAFYLQVLLGMHCAVWHALCCVFFKKVLYPIAATHSGLYSVCVCVCVWVILRHAYIIHRHVYIHRVWSMCMNHLTAVEVMCMYVHVWHMHGCEQMRRWLSATVFTQDDIQICMCVDRSAWMHLASQVHGYKRGLTLLAHESNLWTNAYACSCVHIMYIYVFINTYM